MIRQSRFARAAALAVAAGLFVFSPAALRPVPAQAQNVGTSLFDKSGAAAERRRTPAEAAERAGWVRACDADACSVTAQYRDALKGRLAGSVTFTRTRQGGVRPSWVRATVRAPLGIATQPGVRVMIDGQVEVIPIKTCLPDGCVASADISRLGITTLRDVREVQVHVIAFNDGKTVSMALPAAGLGPLFFERTAE